MDFESNTIKSKETFNKKRGVNSPKAAKAATMLDMPKHAKGSTATNLKGELIVINDNKLLNNDINEKWEKSGKHVNDTGGTVARIKELSRNSKA